MSKRLLLVFSTAVLLFSECVQGPETRRSHLRIFASDVTGASISDVEIELKPVDGAGDTIQTNVNEARVLYGHYQLLAYAKGFFPARRELRIQQPEMFVRVELPVGSTGCPPEAAEIGGKVRRRDATKELWVKATPVRGIGGNETRVTDHGYFLISGLDHSAYIVPVLDGENVLHEQIVRTDPAGSSTRLDIDLLQPK
ncbi:MAG: hypothetical protein U0Q18_19735 [Bryobacteraceae bacterium]